jgi:hypothetical protein
MVWIPEMARKRPAQGLDLRYQITRDVPPIDPERVVGEAVRAAGLSTSGSTAEGWRLSFPGRTRVYGVVSREVDESVGLRLRRGSEAWELRLDCEPVETHAAHAAGFAGVMVVAVTVWIAGGLTAGVLPAVTTGIAGSLLVEVTRQWALDALHNRLRRLVGDVGLALWPGVPAQIVDG